MLLALLRVSSNRTADSRFTKLDKEISSSSSSSCTCSDFSLLVGSLRGSLPDFMLTLLLLGLLFVQLVLDISLRIPRHILSRPSLSLFWADKLSRPLNIFSAVDFLVT